MKLKNTIKQNVYIIIISLVMALIISCCCLLPSYSIVQKNAQAKNSEFTSGFFDCNESDRNEQSESESEFRVWSEAEREPYSAIMGKFGIAPDGLCGYLNSKGGGYVARQDGTSDNYVEFVGKHIEGLKEGQQSVFIITYWNDKNDITEGAHTVMFTNPAISIPMTKEAFINHLKAL